MTCISCGKEVDEKAKFCPECGASFLKPTDFQKESFSKGANDKPIAERNNDSKQLTETTPCTTSAVAPRERRNKNKNVPPVWPIFVLSAAIIGIAVFMIVNLVCFHEYVDATCTKPRTCIKCGKTEGSPLGHRWGITSCEKPRVCMRCGATSNTTSSHDWHISYDEIICKKCGDVLTSAEDIKAKKGKGLTGADKALIYTWLDYYLTAQNSNGKYSYSENEAYRKVQDMFGVTKDYINNNVWNGYAYSDYTQYK